MLSLSDPPETLGQTLVSNSISNPTINSLTLHYVRPNRHIKCLLQPTQVHRTFPLKYPVPPRKFLQTIMVRLSAGSKTQQLPHQHPEYQRNWPIVRPSNSEVFQ